MAEQYFLSCEGIEIETKPHNDGYVMIVMMGDPPNRQGPRRVYFDPAGRITHVR